MAFWVITSLNQSCKVLKKKHFANYPAKEISQALNSTSYFGKSNIDFKHSIQYSLIQLKKQLFVNSSFQEIREKCFLWNREKKTQEKNQIKH